jgi:helix-turn-helix protein
MIKTQAEYANAIDRLMKDREVLEAEERAYRGHGLTDEQVQRALEPHQSFHQQLQDEVDWYDSVRRGEPYCIETLQDIGKMLVALRIGRNLTQRDFARMTGVDESQVSRDERNEYYGITVKRVQDILSTLGASIQVRMNPPTHPDREIQRVEPADGQRLSIVPA